MVEAMGVGGRRPLARVTRASFRLPLGQRRRAVVLAAALACALAGCSSPRSRGTAQAGAGGSDVTAPYVIGPGDKLSVFVYEQPSLTINDVPVRPDGRISIPLADDVVAAGKTTAQLTDELTDRLRKYVRDPNVTVMVHDFVGPFDQQVRVIGEAAEPQAIPYRAHMSVLDVMIATKGLTRFAAGNSAVIVRRAPNGQERVPVHLSDLLKDGDISQNVEMRPGDTLIVPQSWF